MNGGIRGTVRFFIVTIGIVGLTSLSIDATNGLQGSQSALSRLAGDWTSVGCASGTVPLEFRDTVYCVDAFAAAPSADCPYTDVRNTAHTASNLSATGCVAVSEAGSEPWTNIARHQAATACARAGKRLLTPAEWYRSAVGTLASECNVAGNGARSTQDEVCQSGIGTFDMVGNVWELLDAEAVDGTYGDLRVPATGYVQEVNADGFPTATGESPDDLFNADYVWTNATGTYAMMRGGFYGSQDDAGVYTIHAAIEPNFTSQAIGFRCIERAS